MGTTRSARAAWIVLAAAMFVAAGAGCSGQGGAVAAPTAEAATPAPAQSPTETETPAAPLNPVWIAETGGSINKPPLIVGGVVVVVPDRGPLMALDAQTGAEAWQYAPDEGEVWLRSYAGGEGVVYAGLSGGRLVALDAATGGVLWERSLGTNVQAAPLLDGAALIVPTTFVGTRLDNDPTGRAVLYALDPADGREMWAFQTENYILQTPFREGDTLYVAGNYDDPTPVDEGGHTRVYALSMDDRAVRWTYESEDGFPKALYATGSAVAFIGYQDFVSGLDASTGDLLWRRDTGNWVPSLGGAGDAVYFGSANTIVHALDIDTGEVLWEHNIEEGTFNYVLGAPVMVDGALIFLTQHGDIVSLDAGDGSLRWSVPTEIESRSGLTVADGWVYAGDIEGRVYGFALAGRP